MDPLSIRFFDGFMGVGYQFYEVRPKLLLIFDKKKTLVDVWRKVIKWIPDDEISVRFVEKNGSFNFVLYGKSNILDSQWIFKKSLHSSEHHKRFKDDYEGVAYLGFALYVPKDDSYELEVFNYKKRITNIRFLSEEDAKQDEIVLKSKKTVYS